MKNFYLFKSGKIYGPIDQFKMEQMRASGEILNYSWMIEERNQEWVPVDTMPKENPFKVTKQNIGQRTISGTFMILKDPLMGLVKGIHSFGLELFISKEQLSKTRVAGMKTNSPVHLNLLDETNEKWINADVLFQNAEPSGDGLLLRFGWSASPVQI